MNVYKLKSLYIQLILITINFTKSVYSKSFLSPQKQPNT